jgi:hypothetical protein
MDKNDDRYRRYIASLYETVKSFAASAHAKRVAGTGTTVDQAYEGTLLSVLALMHSSAILNDIDLAAVGMLEFEETMMEHGIKPYP